jgi:hypothetical protein
MANEWDWRCQQCGSTAVAHFIHRDRRGRQRWRNRCQSCGHVSEYLPTRAEIEQECQKLRAARGRARIEESQREFCQLFLPGRDAGSWPPRTTRPVAVPGRLSSRHHPGPSS